MPEGIVNVQIHGFKRSLSDFSVEEEFPIYFGIDVNYFIGVHNIGPPAFEKDLYD